MNDRMPRFTNLKLRGARACAIVLSIVLVVILASGFSPMAPAAEKPNVRAITAFVKIDRANYQEQIAGALKMLRHAREAFQNAGYEVETIRISTQPFPEYTAGLSRKQTVAFFRDYDALAAKEGFAAAIGPAITTDTDDAERAALLGEILANAKTLNASILVSGEDGVHWKAIRAAARVMKYLEDHSAHGQGNFNFTAASLVPTFTPFFPAAYHTGDGNAFGIALESANVVAEAFAGAPPLETARKRLADSLGPQAQAIERYAQRIATETSWKYIGMDLSPAPLREISIGTAMENLLGEPLGSSGTLSAAALVTATLRAISVKQAGYSGLMLPILEDSRLAQRWSEGRLTLDSLLAYSAVCGTGLDTVPLPGDITEEQLARIIGDVASLSVKWHKPLAARLFPVPGKKAGDRTEFDSPYLVNATIQKLP